MLAVLAPVSVVLATVLAVLAPVSVVLATVLAVLALVSVVLATVLAVLAAYQWYCLLYYLYWELYRLWHV